MSTDERSTESARRRAAGGIALLALLALPPSAAARPGVQGPSDAGQDGAGGSGEGVAAAPASPAADAPAAGDAPVPPSAPSPYRPQGELDAMLAGWLGTGLAERVDLGLSAGGRPIAGVAFGGRDARPLAERPTVLLLGGLDGVSLAGSEAVLRAIDDLLAAPERLPDGVAFLAVPFANPDGLARQREHGSGDGRDDLPRDEDRDGRVDEDGPDDVDHDGVITSMLIEDPAGPFARAEDDRLLRPARTGDAPRYVLVPEGRDDDGDGAFNEDGPGGVVPDLDFPVDWRGPWSGAPCGPWPLFSPEAMAVAELVLERRVALALVVQGSHGGLAAPGGVTPTAHAGTEVLAPDRVAFELAARRFAEATGRAEAPVRPLREARGAERPGAALDWLYLARGALALEVAPWGPEVDAAGRARVQDARFTADGDDPPARRADAFETAWAAWIDNTRGGIGFVDWQATDLGGARALIGGWAPRTRLNPPGELVETATRGLGDFARALAGDLPRLEIEVLEATRTGEVCVLRARVRNRGRLPTGAGVAAGALGTRVSLAVPEGAEVLVGEREHALGHLPGGGASAELSWVLRLPESAPVTLEAETPWLPPLAREVRP